MQNQRTAGHYRAQPVLMGKNLRLRATRDADCAFVATAEAAPFVGQWSVERHQRAIEDPGTAHWLIEAGEESVGFAVLEGADDPDHSLRLRRIVITIPGSGYGGEAVQLLARYCFDSLAFHRFWLYVAVGNKRAYELYQRLGFVHEGIARECMREGGGYSSMYILSLLNQEYRGRLAG